MRLLTTTAICLIVATPAFGQQATGVGVGISSSKSSALANSTAIGGGAANAQGGKGGSATINFPTQPSATTATVNNEGTSTVKNVPSVFAPGLAAAGLETCLGSVSGGGAFVGTGFSFGTTIPDPGCAARLDARTLWSMGLKKAAVARLCEGSDINRAMPDVCAEYLPQTAPTVYAPAVGATYYYDDPRTYRGGLIMLVDGKTGQDRLCKNYDVSKQRCRVWNDGVMPPRKKRVAAVVKPVASPAPAQAEPEAKTETK